MTMMDIARAFARRLRANAEYAEKLRFSVANLSTMSIADCRALANWIEGRCTPPTAQDEPAAVPPEDIAKAALGIEWRDTESAARRVAEHAAVLVTALLRNVHDARTRITDAASPPAAPSYVNHPFRNDGKDNCAACGNDWDHPFHTGPRAVAPSSASSTDAVRRQERRPHL